MTYTSIIRKGCKGDCGRMPEMGGKGWCFTCKPEYKQAIIDKNKKRNAARLSATKLRSLAKVDDGNEEMIEANMGDKVRQAEMDLFWKNAEREISFMPQCMECGAFIPKPFYRAATSHVLPKRKEYGFPSVASNLNNWLRLGSGCGCHQRYDRSWEDAAQMKIFPSAIAKFKILYPLIDKKELKNLPEVFLQEIEPT